MSLIMESGSAELGSLDRIIEISKRYDHPSLKRLGAWVRGADQRPVTCYAYGQFVGSSSEASPQSLGLVLRGGQYVDDAIQRSQPWGREPS